MFKKVLHAVISCCQIWSSGQFLCHVSETFLSQQRCCEYSALMRLCAFRAPPFLHQETFRDYSKVERKTSHHYSHYVMQNSAGIFLVSILSPLNRPTHPAVPALCANFASWDWILQRSRRQHDEWRRRRRWEKSFFNPENVPKQGFRNSNQRGRRYCNDIQDPTH